MADEKILQALGMRRRSWDKGLPLSSAGAIRRAINVGLCEENGVMVRRKLLGEGGILAAVWSY